MKALIRSEGETVTEDFNTVADLDVDAYIPSEYILNEIQKLDTYKRIAALETQEEINDMRDELKDRFGTVPKACEHLLRHIGGDNQVQHETVPMIFTIRESCRRK